MLSIYHKTCSRGWKVSLLNEIKEFTYQKCFRGKSLSDQPVDQKLFFKQNKMYILLTFFKRKRKKKGKTNLRFGFNVVIQKARDSESNCIHQMESA